MAADNVALIILFAVLTEEESSVLEKIYQMYHKKMYIYIKHVKKRPAMVEDVLQEVFQSLCRNHELLHRFKLDESAEDFYLLKTCIDTCYRTWQRREDRLQEHQTAWPDETRDDRHAEMAPEQILLFRENFNELLALVGQHSEEDAHILYLRYHEDYSIEKIAEITSLKANTVSKRIERIVQRLAQQLKKDSVR